MSQSTSVPALSECRVCLGTHDEEIHAATITIHQWLRHEVARRTATDALALEPIPPATSHGPFCC